MNRLKMPTVHSDILPALASLPQAEVGAERLESNADYRTIVGHWQKSEQSLQE
jgi:hypothetical protein